LSPANLALTCGIVVHLVTYFGPSSALADPTQYKALSLASKLALMLMPNAGVSLALNGIMRYE
jgi:hypothetical protein